MRHKYIPHSVFLSFSDKPPTVSVELCCASGDMRLHKPVLFQLHWVSRMFQFHTFNVLSGTTPLYLEKSFQISAPTLNILLGS